MLKSKRIMSISSVGCSVFFHFSSIVCIPALLLKDILKRTKPLLLIALMFGAIFVLSRNVDLVAHIMFLVRSNEDVASEYSYGAIEGGGSGYGILLQYLFLLPAAFSIKRLSEVDYVFIILYLVSFLFVPFGKTMVIFLRLGLYFSIFIVFLLPRIINICKNRIVVLMTFIMIFVYYLYSYYEFFFSETYGRHFINYSLFFM